MKIFKRIKTIFNRSSDNKLSYSEMKNIIRNNKNAWIIDVRSIQEYREGHLNSAINIPVYDLDKKIMHIVQNKEDIIILYCQTEIRSLKGKRILNKNGYSNVFILHGGMEGIVTIHG